jgi:transcriptional regulator with XRE-family HTH domain
MTRPLDPKLARQQLGQALRAVRNTAGINMTDAAGRVHREQTWLSKVERGITRISPGEVEILLGFYRTDAPVAAQILQLASQAGPARQSAMYREFTEVIASDFDLLLRLEAGADTIRTFECHLIPALAQTEDFTRAIVRAQRPDDPEEVEQLVALRMRRQEILTGPGAPSVTCIVSEAALLQEVGGPEVMAAQLQHMVALVDKGLMEIRVLPFSAGAHAATNGSFVIFTMAPPLPFVTDGPDVVAYQDGLLGCVYHRAKDQTVAFEGLWHDLDDKSLSPEESKIRMIKISRGFTSPSSI